LWIKFINLIRLGQVHHVGGINEHTKERVAQQGFALGVGVGARRAQQAIVDDGSHMHDCACESFCICKHVTLVVGAPVLNLQTSAFYGKKRGRALLVSLEALLVTHFQRDGVLELHGLELLLGLGTEKGFKHTAIQGMQPDAGIQSISSTHLLGGVIVLEAAVFLGAEQTEPAVCAW